MNVKDLRLFFKDRKGNLPIVIINESTGERLLLKPEMIERILSAEFGGEDPDAIGIIFSGEKAMKIYSLKICTSLISNSESEIHKKKFC